MQHRVLDLFSGIGGFSLGLERTGGFRTVAFCEIDPYARGVLGRHWPGVPCFGDVRLLTADDVRDDAGRLPTVIAGGFPCQDISMAGRGDGLAGARSGLWSEYRRLITECSPSYVLIENVAALRFRGLERVLGDLADLGYDAVWETIAASQVGAPHRRERVWIVAYPGGSGVEGPLLWGGVGEAGPWGWGGKEDLSHVASRPFAGRGSMPQSLLRGMDVRLPHRMDRIRCIGNSVVPAIPQHIGQCIIERDRRAAALQPDQEA